VWQICIQVNPGVVMLQPSEPKSQVGEIECALLQKICSLENKPQEGNDSFISIWQLCTEEGYSPLGEFMIGDCP
jgi:hypothetical protein